MNTKKLSWMALYTRSRHEKRVTCELQKRNIEAYTPLKQIQRRWSDRTAVIEEPLFKSYVFVRGDEAEAREAIKTKGAVRFVGCGGRPVPVNDCVIQSLKYAMAGGALLEPFPYLRKGDRAYVRAGIFKGIEGFVIRKDDRKCRVVISIDALMASASLEVDAALVENLSN